MKKNKLFICLIILILIIFFSITASFKECRGSKDTGTGYSEANNNTASSMAGSDADNTTSGTNNTTRDETDGTFTGIGSSTESSTDEKITAESMSEYGGQNGRKAQKFAIILSGASHNRQQYNWFLGSTGMAFKLLKNSGYSDKNIYYLFEDKNELNVDYLSTLSNFKKAVQEIKSGSSAADTILLILIGHGGYNGTSSYYVLSDYNLPDNEMADIFKDIKRDKLIFVFSPCNSGGFVDDLSGSSTVIITSTRKDEANRAAFIEPFLTAFDGSGDKDSDGKVSFAEAFNYASTSVKQQFIDNSWGIQSEHAQLDDNGDKISSEAFAQNGKDGELAGQIFLK